MLGGSSAINFGATVHPSKADFEAWERIGNEGWGFHPAGTCAIVLKQLGGVVDNRLMVHDTKNPGVVDASLFSTETSGNIQATVYAVAEKAADLIKDDHRHQLGEVVAICGMCFLDENITSEVVLLNINTKDYQQSIINLGTDTPSTGICCL